MGFVPARLYVLKLRIIFFLYFLLLYSNDKYTYFKLLKILKKLDKTLTNPKPSVADEIP